MKWLDRLKPMIGRLALLDEGEAAALAKYAGGEGDHVDIGCLWGGTAILAALAKQDAQVVGDVYTIDPMTGGWWGSEDPTARKRPTETAVVDNIKALHVTGRVHIVKAKSHPWPLPASVVPASILIDGDHAYETAAQDWRNASQIAARYILMHDCNSPKHPGIAKAFQEVAMLDDGWDLVEIVHSLAVFEKAEKKAPVVAAVADEIIEPDEPEVEVVAPVYEPAYVYTRQQPYSRPTKPAQRRKPARK